MSEIEVYTGRYEREHLRKPAGSRFWRFTLVSSSITAKDHSLVLQDAMTYQKALAEAQRGAVTLRRGRRRWLRPRAHAGK